VALHGVESSANQKLTKRLLLFYRYINQQHPTLILGGWQLSIRVLLAFFGVLYTYNLLHKK
jgi:hypothetical protein